MNTVGSRLKYAREKKGLIQKVVAQKLGIAKGTLSGYERDYRDPDTNILSEMAEFYGVSVDWLLGRTKEPHQALADGERDLINKINLKDDELLKQFHFTYGDVELPDHVKKKVLAVLRTMLENEPHLKDKEQ